ncbi:MAG TPA: hypothetical protein PKD24_05700 [Pyrinomonadaceae bacterium]|nr:hypothetical protein [Pyrinomonadaceae bacterium]HMP65045.1 hypothetical protein [Pyrinomonadaceae bacterium]
MSRRKGRRDAPRIDTGETFDPANTYYFYHRESGVVRDVAGLRQQGAHLLASDGRPIISIAALRKTPWEAACKAEQALMRELTEICDQLVAVRAAMRQVEPNEIARIDGVFRELRLAK